MLNLPHERKLYLGTLFLVFIQALTAFACAHRFSKPKQLSVSQLAKVQREASDVLNFVMSHIDSDFQKLPTEHHDSIENSEELEQWILALSRLNPTELSQVRSAFQSKTIRSPFIKKHWKLLIRDESSWLSYHTSALNAGATTMGIMSFLVPICPRLPSKLTQNILWEAGRTYSKLMKNTDPRKKKLSPRRYADGTIRCLLRPAEWIQGKLDQGIPSLQAYESYRTLLRDAVFPEEPEYTTYSAAEVVQVGKSLQSWLVSSLPEEAESGGALILMGSFPNFKAKLDTSDIDLVSRGMRKLTGPETTAIREFLQQEGLNSLALPVNADTFTDDWQHSRVNPITIRISKKDIRLQVFPTLPYTQAAAPPLVDEVLAPDPVSHPPWQH